MPASEEITHQVQVDGLSFLVLTGHDEAGQPYVRLEGENCRLEGEQPGQYFLTPAA